MRRWPMVWPSPWHIVAIAPGKPHSSRTSFNNLVWAMVTREDEGAPFQIYHIQADDEMWWIAMFALLQDQYTILYYTAMQWIVTWVFPLTMDTEVLQPATTQGKWSEVTSRNDTICNEGRHWKYETSSTGLWGRRYLGLMWIWPVQEGSPLRAWCGLDAQKAKPGLMGAKVQHTHTHTHTYIHTYIHTCIHEAHKLSTQYFELQAAMM